MKLSWALAVGALVVATAVGVRTMMAGQMQRGKLPAPTLRPPSRASKKLIFAPAEALKDALNK